jgi:hypothetical protein
MKKQLLAWMYGTEVMKRREQQDLEFLGVVEILAAYWNYIRNKHFVNSNFFKWKCFK